MNTSKPTLLEMGLTHADRFVQQKLGIVEQELANKMYENKKAFDKIFNEIVEVSNKLRFAKDEFEKKKLNARLRCLSNKYAFSNGIDDNIIH